ncbi:class I SAM-dependent methyltransferase [Nocardiopsis oceani]
MTGERPGRSWVGDRYADHSGHHRSFDDWFLGQLPPGPGDRIVDAGCGSGEFTARLAGLVPDGQVIGVEPDVSMLAVATRHRAENLEFRQGRLQDLDRVCEPSWADLVVSRAVFHWLALDDYLPSYQAVARVLRPGGWFHAESGGAGNVALVRGLLDDVAYGLGFESAAVTFPDPGSVLELLEQAGFEIRRSGVMTVAQRRSFDREQLLGFIHTQALMAYNTGPGDVGLDRFVNAVSERVDELRRRDGSYDQTFVRLHVLCRRPE